MKYRYGVVRAILLVSGLLFAACAAEDVEAPAACDSNVDKDSCLTTEACVWIGASAIEEMPAQTCMARSELPDPGQMREVEERGHDGEVYRHGSDAFCRRANIWYGNRLYQFRGEWWAHDVGNIHLWGEYICSSQGCDHLGDWWNAC